MHATSCLMHGGLRTTNAYLFKHINLAYCPLLNLQSHTITKHLVLEIN